MPSKELKFDEEARHALKDGVDTPRQRRRRDARPARPQRRARQELRPRRPSPRTASTVAREIELKDRFENMGAQLVKQVAVRTNEMAGDGTTTATVLAQAIFTDGMRVIAAGANPMAIRRGLEHGQRVVTGELRGLASPVEGKDTVAAVAGIAGNDRNIGDLIADVMEKVGKDGVITVEDGKSIDDETEFVDGLQIEHGFISPHFVTNQERQESVIEDAYILVTDYKFSAVQDILPIVEKALQVTKNLVVLCENFEGEALQTMIVNSVRGTLSFLAVRAPSFGDRRKASLEDIAALTGGTFLTADMGRTIQGRPDRRPSAAPTAWSPTSRARRSSTATAPTRPCRARIRQIRAQIEDSLLRVRPREAPGAPRQARRGRGRDQGRRRDGVRGAREEVPRRGRPLPPPAPPSRRASCPAAASPTSASSRRSTAPPTRWGNPEEEVGLRILQRALESPLAAARLQRRPRGLGDRRRRARRRGQHRLRRRARRARRHVRPRHPRPGQGVRGRRWRTPSPSPRSCSRRRAWSATPTSRSARAPASRRASPTWAAACPAECREGCRAASPACSPASTATTRRAASGRPVRCPLSPLRLPSPTKRCSRNRAQGAGVHLVIPAKAGIQSGWRRAACRILPRVAGEAPCPPLPACAGEARKESQGEGSGGSSEGRRHCPAEPRRCAPDWIPAFAGMTRWCPDALRPFGALAPSTSGSLSQSAGRGRGVRAPPRVAAGGVIRCPRHSRQQRAGAAPWSTSQPTPTGRRRRRSP